MLPVENAYSRVEQAVAHKASPDTLSKQTSFCSPTKYLSSPSSYLYECSDKIVLFYLIETAAPLGKNAVESPTTWVWDVLHISHCHLEKGLDLSYWWDVGYVGEFWCAAHKSLSSGKGSDISEGYTPLDYHIIRSIPWLWFCNPSQTAAIHICGF